MSDLNRKATPQLTAYYTAESFGIDYGDTGSGAWDVDGGAGSEIMEWKARFDENRHKALYNFGFLTKKPWFTPQLEFLYHVADLLIQRIVKQPDIELSRDLVHVDLTEEDKDGLKASIPFAIGMEYVDDGWLDSLWGKLLSVFRDEVAVYDGSVAMYFGEHNSNLNVAGRVFFHMVENKENETYPFAFMATYSTKPVKSKKAVHTPLKNALKEFKGDDKKLLSLLSTVTKAAENSAFISGLMESGELFSPIRLTSKEAYTFLKEIPIYEAAGIMCRVPDWWRKKYNTVRLSVTVGEKEPSRLGLDALMDFTPSLYFGEEKLTEKELKQFLTMADGLVQYKGNWVEINKKKLEEALKAFQKAKDITRNGELSLKDALRMELGIPSAMEVVPEDVEITVTNGAWLKSIKDSTSDFAEYEKPAVASSLHATLRTYQKNGYDWLCRMAQLGFGACLADDMGLGKTVQMIAFLEYYRLRVGGKALLILPASLLGNWQRELAKFAPRLGFRILHSSAGKGAVESEVVQPVGKELEKPEAVLSVDKGSGKPDMDSSVNRGSGKSGTDSSVFLTITTYGMAARLESLKDTQWDIVILDEAQAIKNPGTKQTKQIKQIPAKLRFAMTGTPIENRLGDLWSLFDFLNQGLLGSAKEFTQFTKDLTKNGTGYGKLRRMIQPFILRRLKTDKNIIRDLPDKLEENEYASLSKKQVALYQKLVDQVAEKLQEAEGMERKGLVLASIMKFKQICNHPDQYLGREEFAPELSGKFELLREICETIREKRERVLVFTQFREMTEPLAEFLKQIFHREGLVLHGGTPVKDRSRMVERFNSEEYLPFMVLSLKAGGVGLNLTAANHVVHFDRWWNPAVENQATDRAFRIGQTKNVMVHKFVTTGTIEEKIDAMLSDKQRLAGDILSTGGEQWITELKNEELIELLKLGGEVL